MRTRHITLGGFLSRQRLQVDSRFRFGTQYHIFAANPSATPFPKVGGVSWANGACAARLNGTWFQFAPEFKREAVALLETSGRPLMQVATEVGISPSMLRNWRAVVRGGSARSRIAVLAA